MSGKRKRPLKTKFLGDEDLGIGRGSSRFSRGRGSHAPSTSGSVAPSSSGSHASSSRGALQGSSIRGRLEKKLFGARILPYQNSSSSSATNREHPYQQQQHRQRIVFPQTGPPTARPNRPRRKAPPPPPKTTGTSQSQHHNAECGRSEQHTLALLKRSVLGGVLFNPDCQQSAGKPKPVPSHFKTLEEYVKSYEPLILEEARAGLLSDWEENCENVRIHAATLWDVRNRSTTLSHKHLHNTHSHKMQKNHQKQKQK